MKFKPLYFYSGVLVIIIIVLVIISQQNDKKEITKNDVLNEEEMPQDDIHSQFRNKGNDTPSKENLSEEYQKKLVALKNAVDQNPKDTLAIRQYADYLAASHQNDEAVSNYNKILKIDPARIDILFNLSFIYYNIGNMDKADEYNNSILQLNPDQVSALYNKGAIAATQGDTKTAKEIWTKIVEEYPESETTELAKQSLKQLLN